MSETVTTSQAEGWSDLAPHIVRQRLVVEARCEEIVTAAAIIEYLQKLTHVCGMTGLMDPVVHRSDRYGWAGWVHWETSGAHIYAWDAPVVFVSVDIYTCKWFDPDAVVAFTRSFFGATDVAWREV